MDPQQRRVSEIMRTEVATLRKGERMDLVDDLMSLGRVRHMPVVEDGCVVGMVSHRDLLATSLTRSLEFDPAERRSFLRAVQVDEVMTRDVVSVSADASLREAAQCLLERRIGALPVTDSDGKLVGLVTETDLVRAAFTDGGAPAASSEGNIVSDLFREDFEKLQRARDELRVQIHLGAAEAKDLWERLEHKWGELEGKAKLVAREAEEPIHDIRDAAKQLLHEIRAGYDRIREAL